MASRSFYFAGGFVKHGTRPVLRQLEPLSAGGNTDTIPGVSLFGAAVGSSTVLARVASEVDHTNTAQRRHLPLQRLGGRTGYNPDSSAAECAYASGGTPVFQPSCAINSPC